MNPGCLAQGERPPVLYLRSFHKEGLPFVEMPAYEMESFTTPYYLRWPKEGLGQPLNGTSRK